MVSGDSGLCPEGGGDLEPAAKIQGAREGSFTGQALCFVIRPNPPMDGLGLAHCFLLIAACSLTVAVLCFLKGFVLVLPFSGLELAALGWALCFTFRRAHEQEVIMLSRDRVQVQTGRETPASRWSSPRHWTWVVLQSSRHRGHPHRLLLRSGGREVEIGSCLCEKERKALAERLKRVLSFQGAVRFSPQA